MTLLGWDIGTAAVFLGLITGMTYGVLAVGLVLIYRANGIVNFAHGEIGSFGAAFMALAVVEWGVPYWFGFVVALVASASIAALSEVAVVRRLRGAPNVMSIVATLGLAQVLFLLGSLVNNQARAGFLFPQPSFLPEFRVGSLLVTPSYFGMLVITPVAVAGLALFFARTRFGLAVRGSAANRDLARLTGIFSGRMSMIAWAIAGALSAYTSVMLRPTLPFQTGETLGPSTLVRALVPAVIARMTSLPIALAAGIGLGVVEQVVRFNTTRGGVVEVIMFATMLAVLLGQRPREGRAEAKGAWAAVTTWAPPPERLQSVWLIRHAGAVVASLAMLVALVFGVLLSSSSTVTVSAMMAVALVGLSVGIITGLSGELSLGQFAIAGVGGAISYRVSTEVGQDVLAIVAAALGAGVVSLVIGLPALRIRGLMLAVVTLAFALLCSAWLWQESWMFGSGIDPERPTIGPWQLTTSRSYYFFALGVLALGALLARNAWRGGFGRRLRAVRDNESGARAFAVPATRVKLQGFVVAGMLAGVGGAVYTHLFSRVTPATFGLSDNIDVVALTVLGGLGLLAGPFIGVLYIDGVPRFVPLDTAGLAASAAGWLVLVLYFPGGLAQTVAPLRRRAIDLVARWARVDERDVAAVPSTADEQPVGALAMHTLHRTAPEAVSRAPDATPLLVASELRKTFGGVRAVDGVSLSVRRGEILGLIGPNGAGKTTLFELLSGFTKPDGGEIVFDGRDVARLGPEGRASIGLIRSFQDAALFPTMTVLDVLQLAQERSDPTRAVASLAGWHGPERRKMARARELAHVGGLDAYANTPVRALSTGTRRIVELTALLALEPVLLLLDEPSSGIAQRESEALAGLILQMRDALGITLLLIEHDIPLVMGVADRIVAMASGAVIADGTPHEVRAHEQVIESYLGGRVTTIERSGPAATATAGDGRCQGTTRAGTQCSRAAVADGLCAQHVRLAEAARR